MGVALVLVGVFAVPFASVLGISFTLFDAFRLTSLAADWVDDASGSSWRAAIQVFWLLPAAAVAAGLSSAVAYYRIQTVGTPRPTRYIYASRAIGIALIALAIAFVSWLSVSLDTHPGWAFGSGAMWCWLLGAILLTLHSDGQWISKDGEQGADVGAQ